MAEKEIAYISYGIFIFIFIVFFSLLFHTLGDRVVDINDNKDSGLLELKEEESIQRHLPEKANKLLKN